MSPGPPVEHAAGEDVKRPRGRFLTIEGIEGAGKSTLAQYLMASLARRQIPAILTREPGGTPLAEQMRQILLHGHAGPSGQPGQSGQMGDSGELTQEAETLLVFAARSVHLTGRIAPALAAGTWVVCDRFTDATYAYQGGGRGVALDWIETLAQRVQGALKPDLTFLLDLPVAVGLARARARGGPGARPDRFEAQQEAFFERVAKTYRDRAAADPARIRVIDAAAPAALVEAKAEQLLQQLVAA